MAKSRVNYHRKDLSAPKDRNFKDIAKDVDLDLFKADFSYANLQGMDFGGLQLREADFSHAKLKGSNFSGADLRGAKFIQASVHADTDADSYLGNVNFSDAKIQGTDFSKSSLCYAKFTGAKAGSVGTWHINIISLIALLGSGFTAAIASTFFFHFFSRPPQKSSHASFQRSSLPGQKPSLLASCIIFLLSVALIVIIRIIIKYTFGANYIIWHISFGIALIFALLALALIMSESEVDVSSLFIISFIALSPLLAKEVLPFGEWEKQLLRNPTNGTILSGIFGAIVGASLGCWFSRLAICKNEKFSWLNFDWLWKMYVKFAVISGTIFNYADLTGVDFESANLKGASFENAIIEKARWRGVEYLDCAHVGINNYLNYPGIRYLLVVANWKEQSNFDGLDLKGIYLEGANLEKTSFVGANLSQADLRSANLTFANLKKASLDDAKLQGANLTGACIQSWSIDEKTSLDGVICKFVFLKDEDETDHEKGIRERLPDASDDDFDNGDFETLFGKDSATVQLLVRNSDNRQALTAAFQQLAQDRDTDYTFQGFEVIGKNALVKIRVSQGTNKAAVKSKFYQTLKQQQPMQQAQQGSEFQSYDLREFIPKLMLILEEIKEILKTKDKGPVNVGTYNVFKKVISRSFVQRDLINTDDNPQVL